MDATAAQTAAQPESSTGCCPRFAPEPWRERVLEWRDKLFIKKHVRSFFHVPVKLEQVFSETQALIEAAGASCDQPIVLTDEKSPWGADYYFAVSKQVPQAEMTTLSGTFVTQVFEGPYGSSGKWRAQMLEDMASRGKAAVQLFSWYTTCPKCAKAYGKNYVVLFAKLA